MKKRLMVVLFVVILFGGCQNYTWEKDAVVKEISLSGNNEYKYRVVFNARIHDHVLYTNTNFTVGDRIVFKNEEK